MTSPDERRIAVVGASLAGLRTAEAFRTGGWQGSITLIGAESHPPYSRPPLSKGVTDAADPFSRLALRSSIDIQATWVLGRTVEACDLTNGVLRLDDGTTLTADAVVAATGTRARRLPLDRRPANMHTVRTIDDALALGKALRHGTRVVVAGAGFIGCEIAATASQLGCRVHVVTFDQTAMIAPLGHTVGAALQRRHERSGITFHTGRTVVSVQGDDRCCDVILDDGTTLRADVTIEAIGSVCNTEWLTGNGLDLHEGVLCDNDLHAVASTRTAIPIAAVGDVARFPNPIFDAEPRRIEHWQMAVDTARHAARTLLHALGHGQPVTNPFTPLPSFWSNQGSSRLQSFGLPGLADHVEILDGDLDHDFVVGYRRHGSPIGVMVCGGIREAARYRRWLAEHLTDGLVPSAS
jgi:3-phenylpropionate/trans-cinnamate dioxygenase ferredoxin reductase component